MMDEASDIALELIADAIIKDAQESVKVDALNGVNTDALFEKATGHRPDDIGKGESGLKKSNEDKLEDAIVDGFLNFF